MEQTLKNFLIETGQDRYFRSDTLNAEVWDSTTLQDILDNPQTTLLTISTLRGMGQVSFARLRQFLARQYAETFPFEWAHDGAVSGSGADGENETIQKLSNFRNVWNVATETALIHGRYYPTAELKVDAIVDRLHKREGYVHVLQNLPDAAKTNEVLAYERSRDQFATSLSEKLRMLEYKQKNCRSRGLILLSKDILESLVKGTGFYCGVRKEARTQQIEALRAFSNNYDESSVGVVDYVGNGLSSGYVSGEGPLLTYIFGGIIELTAPDLVQIFRRRANRARENGQSLSEWLEAIK